MENESPKEKEPPTVKPQPSDVERYERLQVASERQIENIWKAYDRHASLIKWAVIAIVAVGGFFFYSNIQGFKEDIRNSINEQMRNLTNRMEIELTSMTNRVEAKIADESHRIDDGIEERFRKENIDKLMEAKVEVKVSQMTDVVISNHIRDQFDPKLRQMANEMSAVSGNLTKAEDILNDLDQLNDVMVAVIAASSDSRKAFEHIVQIGNNSTNNKLRKTAIAFGNGIAVNLNEEVENLCAIATLLSPNWTGMGFRPHDATIDDYYKAILFSDYPAPSRCLILVAFSREARFTKSEKLKVYRIILKTDLGLKVLTTVCQLVDNDFAHIHKGILSVDDFLQYIDGELKKDVPAAPPPK